MKDIILEIGKLKQDGVEDMFLIALVSETSSEVMFYCMYHGKRIQSNMLVEEEAFDASVIDEFYRNVTLAIRNDERFRVDQMNIVKIHGETIDVKYDEKRCQTYKIIKSWIVENGLEQTYEVKDES